MKGASATVWYWKGDRERGEWCRTHGNTSDLGLRETFHKLRSAGYVAHLGSLAIGAPEGPPSDEDFKDVSV